MKQYGRQIKLYLGNASQSIECGQLRITFDITKTITENPNPAQIRIFNLNESNRNAIRSKHFDKVELHVGYAELRVIYSGDIVKSRIVRENQDIVTELECGDGANDITYASVNRTVAAGASDTAIVNETLKSMGRVSGGITEIPNQRVLPRAKVLSGNSRDYLSGVARNNNADWSVQDGSILMLPKDSALAVGDGFVLSKDTGMIGAPEETESGLKVTCLLNPDLRIGSLIRIESIFKHFNGDYKITELSHTGDYLSDQWYSNIVCVGGEFQKVNK